MYYLSTKSFYLLEAPVSVSTTVPISTREKVMSSLLHVMSRGCTFSFLDLIPPTNGTYGLE